jgi:hypothetical protein
VEQWQKKLEQNYAWQRKGKKFKASYFGALKALYGDSDYDKDCQHQESDTNRSAGANKICGVAKKAGL